MKKAKVMLASIAVFGIVGGALAFKAHNFTDTNNLYCNSQASQGNDACSVNGVLTTQATIGEQYTTLPNSAGTVASGFCTFDAASGCTATINVYTTTE